jgi:hypothetical protein
MVLDQVVIWSHEILLSDQLLSCETLKQYVFHQGTPTSAFEGGETCIDQRVHMRL